MLGHLQIMKKAVSPGDHRVAVGCHGAYEMSETQSHGSNQTHSS